MCFTVCTIIYMESYHRQAIQNHTVLIIVYTTTYTNVKGGPDH